MPAEWERHDGCWMLWPERTANWREDAKPAQAAFTEVADAISAAGDQVTMGASAAQLSRARAMLPDTVRVVELSADDSWARDQGPTFLVDMQRHLRGVDWTFDAWGGLYEPAHDILVARKILEFESCDRYASDLILEGGAIHVDGDGTCLTTEQCLLARNPRIDKPAIERLLCSYLGVEKVIWLGHGLPGDVTGGHVDNLACFVAPGAVCLTWTDDRDDPLHAVCTDALARLQRATDARGRRFEVHTLPSPGPLAYLEQEARAKVGRRLAASYVNFYIANNAVIVPLLDPRTDDHAIDVLRSLFPGRPVRGLPGREILLGGGNIHCITQQVPARANCASPPCSANRPKP